MPRFSLCLSSIILQAQTKYVFEARADDVETPTRRPASRALESSSEYHGCSAREAVSVKQPSIFNEFIWRVHHQNAKYSCFFGGGGSLPYLHDSVSLKLEDCILWSCSHFAVQTPSSLLKAPQTVPHFGQAIIFQHHTSLFSFYLWISQFFSESNSSQTCILSLSWPVLPAAICFSPKCRCFCFHITPWQHWCLRLIRFFTVSSEPRCRGM